MDLSFSKPCMHDKNQFKINFEKNRCLNTTDVWHIAYRHIYDVYGHKTDQTAVITGHGDINYIYTQLFYVSRASKCARYLG